MGEHHEVRKEEILQRNQKETMQRGPQLQESNYLVLTGSSALLSLTPLQYSWWPFCILTLSFYISEGKFINHPTITLCLWLRSTSFSMKQKEKG